MRRWSAYVVAVLVTVAGAIFAIESPAMASGTCWTYGFVWNGDHEGGYRAIPMGSGSDAYNCGMAQGAVSDWVRLLQRSLNKCYGSGQPEPGDILNDSLDGYTATGDLAVDGQFGSLTKRALQKAQHAAGITADGQYGPQTRSHIDWWTGGAYGVSGTPECYPLDHDSSGYPIQYDGSWGWPTTTPLYAAWV